MAGVGSGGPFDDPSDRPTRMANYGADGSLQQVLDDEPDLADEAADSDFAPDPWYRNRVLLALWALALALLLALIIYGLVELSRGGEGGGPATTTSSTTKSTTKSPSSTTSSTTTTTTTNPSSSSEAPAPETPTQTPEEAPPASSPAPTEPPRHHHHLHLPHLPRGFF